MKAFFKEYWFQIAVIALLIMCFIRLGEINDNVFYVADIVDSSASSMNSTLLEYLPEIESNTDSTAVTLQNLRY